MFARLIQFVVAAVVVSGCSSIEQHNTALNQDQVEPQSIHKIIDKAEKKNGIPSGILNSIAAVESAHNPYAVNTNKKSHIFESKEDAAKFIDTSIKKGCKNISVGCLQLHYKTHGKNFSSIDDMLDPKNNAYYAAELLKKLYTRYGSWEEAIKMYHTSKAKYNNVYYNKVMKKYNAEYRAS